MARADAAEQAAQLELEKKKESLAADAEQQAWDKYQTVKICACPTFPQFFLHEVRGYIGDQERKGMYVTETEVHVLLVSRGRSMRALGSARN